MDVEVIWIELCDYDRKVQNLVLFQWHLPLFVIRKASRRVSVKKNRPARTKYANALHPPRLPSGSNRRCHQADSEQKEIGPDRHDSAVSGSSACRATPPTFYTSWTWWTKNCEPNVLIRLWRLGYYKDQFVGQCREAMMMGGMKLCNVHGECDKEPDRPFVLENIARRASHPHPARRT